ncbi:MAG: hypothetical protein WC838_05405 [Candidatus Margulisiibacteriota bacterium]|jgi:hypothetical protein
MRTAERLSDDELKKILKSAPVHPLPPFLWDRIEHNIRSLSAEPIVHWGMFHLNWLQTSISLALVMIMISGGILFNYETKLRTADFVYNQVSGIYDIAQTNGDETTNGGDSSFYY